MIEKECVHLINRTWQASDGCGNVVYLNQVIKIKRPRLLVHFPLHVPNSCVGERKVGVWGKDRYRVVRGGEEGAERSDRYRGGK